jgi:hypothetical protein
MLLSMERGGKMAVGDEPLDPNAVTDAALNVGMLGSLGTAPSGALGMGVRSDLRNITNHAKRLGYSVEKKAASNISDSNYLYLSHPGTTTEAIIRVSDHSLPPSYGGRGGYIDVGPHGEGMSWESAVSELARRVNKPVPDEVSKIIAAARMENDAAIAARDAWQARRNNEAARVSEIMAERGLDDLTGRQRKRARQRIRSELGLREE